VLDVQRNEKRRRIILTIVWFVASLLLAVFVPDIGKVISLLGSLAAVFIFVFPGRFDLHHACSSTSV
jgi:sodium-coupled neutral amino acid transporter 7/8